MTNISNESSFGTTMRPKLPKILLEDNHLLAVDKPAGLATMGVGKEEPSLLTWAKDYLKRAYDKPGNVYVGIVSRLDAPVTGIVIMARTSKAAARLTEQFRASEVEKTYWALVAGRPRPAAGDLEDWIKKDERHRKVHLCQPGQPGARQARLSYRTLAKMNDKTLLEVRLHTGRKHQIRVQLAHLGHPIIGDRKYGSRAPFAAGIALHSRRLGFTHPVQKSAVELVAPLPNTWLKIGVPERQS